MERPVRIILKSVRTDANGQLIESKHKTIDIDNKEIEGLLFGGDNILGKRYEVVGAEILNEALLTEKYLKKSDIPF